MKNIQYNYKKVKNKNIRSEINKINYKTSNEINNNQIKILTPITLNMILFRQKLKISKKKIF